MNSSILVCKCNPTPDATGCDLAGLYDRDGAPPRCPCVCHRLAALERPVVAPQQSAGQVQS